jgi:hypothetical protein
MNWVTIVLMLVIAGIAGHLALGYFGVESATDTSTKNVPDQINPATSPVNLRWDGTFQATETD